MTRSEFVAELENALELDRDTLKENLVFSDVPDWDSMASLIFIALADEKLGKTIDGDQIARCRSMGDLLALVEDSFSP